MGKAESKYFNLITGQNTELKKIRLENTLGNQLNSYFEEFRRNATVSKNYSICKCSQSIVEIAGVQYEGFTIFLAIADNFNSKTDTVENFTCITIQTTKIDSNALKDLLTEVIKNSSQVVKLMNLLKNSL